METMDLSTMTKADLITYIQKKEQEWMAFCNEQAAIYQAKARDMEADLRNHPDYQAMKNELETLKTRYAEVDRQRRDAQQKVVELRKEIRRKAGRPALDPMIVDRIHELRNQGWSIRKIVAVLDDEGLKVSRGAVGKYLSIK